MPIFTDSSSLRLPQLGAAVAIVAAIALAGAGCSASIGGKSVSESEVEDKISLELGAQFEIADLPVDCPEDLDAEVGTTMQCNLTDPTDGIVYPVDVVVDSVEGDQANFSFEVGEPAAG
nr:DUF4333 domain-containing protein [Micromonospora sp. DSM 115978]